MHRGKEANTGCGFQGWLTGEGEAWLNLKLWQAKEIKTMQAKETVY